MEKFMNLALKEAEKAFKIGEVPIGAVIVKDGVIISKAFNKKESKKCVTEHAEIIAIRKASKKLKNWRLDDCDLYVTLDPCPMCASAIKQSRIKNVFSATSNSYKENFNIISEIFKSDSTNSSVNFISGLEEEKSMQLLRDFFKIQRKK